MLNDVTLVGRLVRDPETKAMPSGVVNARFTLAINSGVKKKDSEEYKTDFIPVEAWAKTAEFVARYVKGDLLQIKARLERQEWEDKKEPGKMIRETKVIAIRAVRLAKSGGQAATEDPQEGSEEIPF